MITVPPEIVWEIARFLPVNTNEEKKTFFQLLFMGKYYEPLIKQQFIETTEKNSLTIFKEILPKEIFNLLISFGFSLSSMDKQTITYKKYPNSSNQLTKFFKSFLRVKDQTDNISVEFEQTEKNLTHDVNSFSKIIVTIKADKRTTTIYFQKNETTHKVYQSSKNILDSTPEATNDDGQETTVVKNLLQILGPTPIKILQKLLKPQNNCI